MQVSEAQHVSRQPTWKLRAKAGSRCRVPPARPRSGPWNLCVPFSPAFGYPHPPFSWISISNTDTHWCSLAHAGHSGNAHIRCCAKQQAQYKSNGKLKRIICEKCDSGYTPSKNKEQCNSIVGGTCSKGKGPTPGYLGPQKCVRCTDANCKACPNLFTECTQYVYYSLTLLDSAPQCSWCSLSVCLGGIPPRQVQERIRRPQWSLLKVVDVEIDDQWLVRSIVFELVKFVVNRVFRSQSLRAHPPPNGIHIHVFRGRKRDARS